MSATAPLHAATGSTERSELAALDADTLRGALLKMHLIRKFEEAAEASYMRGLIHGTMHLSIGQEASAVGSILALRPQDYILSTHRGHGHCIAKGELLTYANCAPDERLKIVEVRRAQDAQIAPAHAVA